jgi:hypothetical protein
MRFSIITPYPFKDSFAIGMVQENRVELRDRRTREQTHICPSASGRAVRNSCGFLAIPIKNL